MQDKAVIMNIIAVYDKDCKNILMCLRNKNPYKGLFNLVGGHVESGETDFQAAYRELEEETEIKKSDIELCHVMDFTYYLSGYNLQAYFGILNKNVTVHGDENELMWMPADFDFFDMNYFAGEGNIGHLIEQIKIHGLIGGTSK